MSEVGFGLSTGKGISALTNGPTLTNEDKWWISFLFGLVAFVVFSAPTFGFTNMLFGSKCVRWSTWGGGMGATFFGLFLHAIVFMLLARLLLG